MHCPSPLSLSLLLFPSIASHDLHLRRFHHRRVISISTWKYLFMFGELKYEYPLVICLYDVVLRLYELKLRFHNGISIQYGQTLKCIGLSKLFGTICSKSEQFSFVCGVSSMDCCLLTQHSYLDGKQNRSLEDTSPRVLLPLV